MPEHDLVFYPGVLVSFRVPPQIEAAVIDEAIAKIKRDIENSIECHLPSGCIADLEKMG